MTKEGILYVQEELPRLVADDVHEAMVEAGRIAEAPDERPAFQLEAERLDVEPTNHGGSWGNVEKRWPNSSKIPIFDDQTHIGWLNITMESTVKRDMTGAEYVGRELEGDDVELLEADQ